MTSSLFSVSDTALQLLYLLSISPPSPLLSLKLTSNNLSSLEGVQYVWQTCAHRQIFNPCSHDCQSGQNES